ncbi:barstar family protein [Stenotrophomonas tumulicola]|uniref:Barstar family protein n=1 Tax=Stenotrophomonas tumulicola TaxID=1685415 RepID=A0A7W3FN19_9GAMM|nr:barstar family protein [Stenotrophomonas tumulicola]MBA8682586.1 barstar family protein [Stenotrophomonas tumulicola]
MTHDAFGLGLHDLNNAGVYAIGDGDESALAAAMRDAGLRVSRVDLDGVRDKRTLLARLAAQLDFPPGFGGNWDALSDNLRDLQWLPAAAGHALFFDHVDALRSQPGKDFDTLLQILDEASQYWAGQDVPMWAFLSTHESPLA